MKIWAPLSRRLLRAEETFIAILILAITAVIFLNVIQRYFFGSSLSWAEEFSRYAVVWMTFIGASVCVSKGIHIAVDVWSGRLGKTLDRGAVIVTHLISIAFCAAMFWLGLKITLKIFHLSQKTIALGMPMWVVYAAIPTGAALMGIRFAEELAKAARSGGPPQQSSESTTNACKRKDCGDD